MRLKFELLVPSRHFAVGHVGHVGQPVFTRPQGVPRPSSVGGTCGTEGEDEEILSHVSHIVPRPVGRENASVYEAVPLGPHVPREKRDVGKPTPVYDPLAGEPAAWEDELHQWVTSRCAFRDRAWGGVSALHRDYVEWSHASGNIPPATISTFRLWIGAQGFVLTGTLVCGLVLAEDLRPGRLLTSKQPHPSQERVADGLRRPFTLRYRVQ